MFLMRPTSSLNFNKKICYIIPQVWKIINTCSTFEKINIFQENLLGLFSSKKDTSVMNEDFVNNVARALDLLYEKHKFDVSEQC